MSLDDVFRAGVAAMDAGDVNGLQELIAVHPMLACTRLDEPGPWLRSSVGQALETFFQRPYLLWFVAEDPVRNGRLPANAAEIARIIVDAAAATCPNLRQEQLDYALRLVSWSWIARDCGVQIPLIDVLVDAGASFGYTPNDALVNGNVTAARHLIDRGASLTLAAALSLGRWSDARRLGAIADTREKQFALTLAALRGRGDALRMLLPFGVDVNTPSLDLYPHGTPLHHAVTSGSLEAVQVLVDAGARLDSRDTVYGGTPREWAEHSAGKGSFADIASYLRGAEAKRGRGH